jgi:hypothetical protein
MLFDFYFAFAVPSATAASKADTKIALAVSVGFFVISIVYLLVRSATHNKPMMISEKPA